MRRLCLDRGVKVECIVVQPDRAHDLFNRAPPEGRSVFDHDWVERYYERAILRAANEIDHLERELSGFGEAHRETERRAREIFLWRP